MLVLLAIQAAHALHPPTEQLTYALHKPRGVLSINQRKQDNITPTLTNVMLDAGFSPMAGHVGRLDVQTSGVILVTADSALHRAILHQPDKSDGVELTKEYTLLLLGQHRSGSHAIASLAEPLTFSRSSSLVYADAARVRHLRCFQDDAIAAGGYRNIDRVAAYPDISSGPTDEGTEADARCGWLTEVSVQICQGRHHQIRRLCARAGLHLLHLRRVAIGPVRLGDMRPGEVRLLGSEEKARLYAACWPRILPALQRGEIAASVAVERKRRRELKQRWRRAEAEGSRPEEEAATTMSRLPMRSAAAADRGGLTGRSRAESMRISMRARREEVGKEEEAPEGGYVRFAGRRVISRRLSLQLGGVVGLSALAGVAARVAEARQRREGDL